MKPLNIRDVPALQLIASGPRWSGEIASALGRNSVFDPPFGHAVGMRLERLGLVRSYKERPVGCKQYRRYFEITDAGRSVLASAQREGE